MTNAISMTYMYVVCTCNEYGMRAKDSIGNVLTWKMMI